MEKIEKIGLIFNREREFWSVLKVWLEYMSQAKPGQASLTSQCALMYKLRLHVTRELFLNGILFYNIMNIRIMYCIYYGIIIIKIFLPQCQCCAVSSIHT